MKLIIIIGMLACAAMAQDCKNPLLDSEFNPQAISTGILTEPIVGKGIKICPGLNGGKVCCDADAFAEIKTNFDDFKASFSKKNNEKQNRMKKLTDKYEEEDFLDEYSDIMADEEATEDLIRKDKDIGRRSSGSYRILTQKFLRNLGKKADKDAAKVAEKAKEKKYLEERGVKVKTV